MAVFVAACDESAGKTKRDHFYFGGFVGPEEDWSRFFTPAWQERVLDGPPSIPFLHMTDIRSPYWRDKHGISELQAFERVEEAFVLLDAMQSFYPIEISVDGGLVRDAFETVKITEPGRKPASFEPDYLCFLAYTLAVLNYVHAVHPHVEKVDFIIERNGHITRHIEDFHRNIASNLERMELAALSNLVGELIPAGKDRIPLQAADVLCWHSARSERPELMEAADIRRYAKLAHRKGKSIPLPPSVINELAESLRRTQGV